MSSIAPPPPLLPTRRGGGPPGMRRAAGEAGVVKTNDDAQATKLSCASLGYFSDAVLPLLHKALPGSSSRKPPIINRGTWARHAAMRQVTSDFVAACSSRASSGDGAAGDSDGTPASPVCQVVALGAGTDSSWFSLQQQAWPLLPTAHFIELDFQEVVSKKARTVLSTPQLLQLLPEGTTAVTAPPVTASHAPCGSSPPAAVAAVGLQSPPVAAGSTAQPAPVTWTKPAAMAAGAAASAPIAVSSQQDQLQQQQQQPQQQPPPAVLQHVQQLTGSRYSLVAADLRDMRQFKSALNKAGLKPQLPTLYVCECVLTYLEPSEAEAVLATTAALAAEAGGAAAIAIYEQTRPDDAFGSTMMRNLEARGCPLRSVLSVPTPASQAQRLSRSGWSAAAAADLEAIYYGSSSGSSSTMPVRPAALSAGGAVAAALGSVAPSAAAGSQAASPPARGWLRPCWQAERARIERLELLDELEEWRLLQAHYCLALGTLGDRPDGWLADALQLQQLAALNK